MSSIIEGFNYDIFISYRLRDNKGEKWVSEFVDALRNELESTLKDDISIYYDENPHDGLLETNDVDASLSEKLKCVIFIPIISRIYCDPKAFAWMHEFIPFVQMASNDGLGLKVTLPNGNVSTRVLPVKIHELDSEDIHLCESLLGSVLRGVDFIYKSPGVNRPLRANEDHPQDNINKTYYRDQINKVANAICDILNGLKYDKTGLGKIDPGVQKTYIRNVPETGDRIKKTFHWQKLKKKLIFLLSVLIILPSGYLIYRNIYLNSNEKSIAIRLQNTTGDTLLNEAASEFNILLNQKLALVKRINMKPGFETDRFFETEKSLVNIRKGLRANYFLSGNIKRKNKEITIWVELSETGVNKVIWNRSIPWTNEKMVKYSGEIVRIIANKMNVTLTPEEEKQIDTEISVNPDINLKYLSADKDLNDAWYYYNYGDKFLDSSSFNTAIRSYDKIIKEKPTALAYAKRAIARSWGFYLKELDSSNIVKCKDDIEKALALNRNLSEIDIAQGFYYYYCLGQNEKALDHFENASVKDPGNYKPLFYSVLVNRRLGRWQQCQKLLKMVTDLNPREALFLTNIGMTYAFLHNYDSALLFHQKAIDQIPEWPAGYKNKFDALILKKGSTSEAQELIDEAIKKTGDKMMKYRVELKMYEKKFSEALALSDSANQEDFEYTGEKYIFMAKLNKALNNNSNGVKYYESARLILSQAIKKKPDESILHGLLGLAYAGINNKTKALEEEEIAIQIAHIRNRVDESEMKMYLAEIYTMFGDYDDVYPRIQFLLNNPSFFSKKLLLTDPIWILLLDRPEYKKILR